MFGKGDATASPICLIRSRLSASAPWSESHFPKERPHCLSSSASGDWLPKGGFEWAGRIMAGPLALWTIDHDRGDYIASRIVNVCTVL